MRTPAQAGFHGLPDSTSVSVRYHTGFSLVSQDQPGRNNRHAIFMRRFDEHIGALPHGPVSRQPFNLYVNQKFARFTVGFPPKPSHFADITGFGFGAKQNS